MSSVKRNKTNHSWKFWSTNSKKHFLTLYEMFIWDASFYSVSHLLNNFPDLPRFASLVFSIDRWNLTASFLDNFQVVLNIYLLLKAGIYSLASNKLQCTLHAISTQVIYPLTFVASIEGSGLYNFDRSEHILHYFLARHFKSVRLLSINGSGFLS